MSYLITNIISKLTEIIAKLINMNTYYHNDKYELCQWEILLKKQIKVHFEIFDLISFIASELKTMKFQRLKQKSAQFFFQ